MYQLKFDENLCKTCPTGDCLIKCQYMDSNKNEAIEEMVKISKGEVLDMAEIVNRALA